MEEMAGKAGRGGSASTHQGAVHGAGVHSLKPGCLAGAVPKTPILVVDHFQAQPQEKPLQDVGCAFSLRPAWGC